MTLPKGLRGYHPPVAPEDRPRPTHVGTDELGHRVPLRSNDIDQWLAKTGLILRVVAGSAMYGTTIDDGRSDIDEMGVFVEPPRTVIGFKDITQYRYRSAEPDGPPADGRSVRSGPGDLDLVVYSLRHFAALAAAGNPNLLLVPFVGDELVLYSNGFGSDLRDRAEMFVSRSAAQRFIRYLDRQRDGLLGKRSGGTRNQGRADIRAEHGYDVKFAMHMVRLGVQGVELMRTGRITLPIPEPELTWLRDLRQGRHTKDEALARADELEREIASLAKSSHLPDEPDRDAIDRWVVNVHRKHWKW